jgi:hypothetical protein
VVHGLHQGKDDLKAYALCLLIRFEHAPSQKVHVKQKVCFKKAQCFWHSYVYHYRNLWLRAREVVLPGVGGWGDSVRNINSLPTL